ncbi:MULTISPECIES: membrane-targeted effector domain-containing toxin [unclassified Pseudomonas]|uniref:membrane-targeted effector domain-containing toxin n=1 Tax=unclassified Pseudomonas TaxID=196821 RepID=UPI0025D9A23C|nr:MULTISPECIES: membrane-targeted effector domain-containing toxin [unclassified Pseudomonas]
MPSLIANTLDLNADRTSLEAISKKLVANCPDMREMARAAASELLRKHCIDHLEPDAVYWHRFDVADSSAFTFSGWRHLAKPISSLTLPQLVMHRFNAADQEQADTLQVMSGFYTAGPDAEVFDESNQVCLLPKDAMDAFWALDFKRQFTFKMNTFWQNRAHDFRTLAKASFIARAVEDHRSGALDTEQFGTLMAAVGVDPGKPITLAMLQSEVPLGVGIRVAKLDIAGYESSDLLRIVEDSGRQFLYVPGEVNAFHVFDTPDALQWWLMNHCNEVHNRAQLMSHFPLSVHAQGDQQIGLNHALDLMFSNWGTHAQSVINRDDRSVSGDPFTHLRDAARARMKADAEFALYSNNEMRRQMWIGYLQAFGQTFGALAALDWPIALAAVGAGLVDVGLNVDEAIHGHTTADRKSGVIGAILSGIDVLFNAAFLAQGATPELADIAPEGESIAAVPDVEIEAPSAPSSAQPQPAMANPTDTDELADLLKPFETNEVLEDYPQPPTSGRMRNVYQTDHDTTLISIEGIGYQVRYVNELNSWVIVDPQNPFSFHRNLPVRLNAAGNWEPVQQGLRGGGGALRTLSARTDSVGPILAAPPSPYDLPQRLREPLRARVENPSNRPFEGNYMSLDPNDPIQDFFAMRRRLASDTDAFYAHLQLPERPPIPVIASESTPKVALKQFYETAPGLVIGESHNCVASKQFLIDNMGQLAKQKVRTLYMEHLLTDLHQADLDTFARTGAMPAKLEAYLEQLDWGHLTDSTGRYTFLNLVKTANRHRLNIRAIDCMSSYRFSGLPDRDRTVRLKLMNYFAHTVINADQAALGRGRWVALVGNAHANTYRQVAGVAEIEGVVGLRIVDVNPGEATGYDVDPGANVNDAMGRPVGSVKSDLRLRMAVKGRRAHFVEAPNLVHDRLPHSGEFAIMRTGDTAELVHRSRDGLLHCTPIKQDGTQLYIQRPEWPAVSGRRYGALAELTAALKLTGLRQSI